VIVARGERPFWPGNHPFGQAQLKIGPCVLVRFSS
jgi:hypothetical protein